MSDRPNKSFLRWKSNISPEWLTWASFPTPTIPTMALLRHDVAEAATSVPLFRHASVHLGRVAGRLLCQDETAFLVLLTKLELLHQLGKAGKRKQLH